MEIGVSKFSDAPIQYSRFNKKRINSIYSKRYFDCGTESEIHWRYLTAYLEA